MRTGRVADKRAVLRLFKNVLVAARRSLEQCRLACGFAAYYIAYPALAAPIGRADERQVSDQPGPLCLQGLCELCERLSFDSHDSPRQFLAAFIGVDRR